MNIEEKLDLIAKESNDLWEEYEELHEESLSLTEDSDERLSIEDMMNEVWDLIDGLREDRSQLLDKMEY